MLLLGKPLVDCLTEKLQNQFCNLNCKLYTIGFENEQWQQYVGSLDKSAQKYGVSCENLFVEDGIEPTIFFDYVKQVSTRVDCSALMLQQPLPKQYQQAVEFVDVKKDVDCLNPLSVANLYYGKDGFRPATPKAVLSLLDYYNINLQGKNVVVVGRGNTVGKPLALMLLSKNATVTVCHTKTVDLPNICKNADIIISACGVAGLITADFVTEKSIVIDVGLSFVDGKTCGDVSAEVYDICQAVSPVPGGIGPVTRAMLFENVLLAVKEDK